MKEKIAIALRREKKFSFHIGGMARSLENHLLVIERAGIRTEDDVT